MIRSATPFVLFVVSLLFVPTRSEAQFHFSADVDVDVDIDLGIGGHTDAHGHRRSHGHVVLEEEHHGHVVTTVPAPPAAHPPVVVVGPPPTPPHQVVIVTPAPRPAPQPPAPRAQPNGAYPPPSPSFRPHRDRPAAVRQPTFGLRGALIGAGGGGAALAGTAGALRFRPIPRFALDIGAAAMQGIDWAQRERLDASVFVEGRLYLNPRGTLQPYGVGGLGVSWGVAEHDEEDDDLAGDHFEDERTMAHLSGSLGAGLELRLASFFSIDLEARALVRHKVADSESSAEFVERRTLPDGSIQERSTDLSGAAVLSLGAVLYL